MVLGVRQGSVTLLPYDSQWHEEFEAEKQHLLHTFSDRIVAIEHIGSTALPGGIAKPIIDINVAIPSLALIDRYIEPLQRLGYEHMPERRFDDRYFFPKGPRERRTHHLNLVEKTSVTGWLYPLLFRDYMLAHPDELQRYDDLKLRLAAAFADDRTSYTEAKSTFVLAILEKAKRAYPQELTSE